MNLEVIDLKRKEVLEVLKKLPFIDNFELGGGTGLALQLGHRVSIDFDFFTKDYLSEDFRKDIEKYFQKSSFEFKVDVNTVDELTFFLDDVKVTFLYYPFPRLLPCVEFEGIKILNVLEIAATKAYTIGRRVEYKDYVDLYFILNEGHTSLKEILNLSEKKYGSVFNSRLFLEQLLLNKGFEDVDIEFVKEGVSNEEIFDFFEDIVKKNLT